jgi:hypothetical protein
MKSEHACPFCKTHVIEIVSSPPDASKGLQARCDNCGAYGPIGSDKEEALFLWSSHMTSDTSWGPRSS